MLHMNANRYLGVIDMTLWQCFLWIVLLLTAICLSSTRHKRRAISYVSVAICIIAFIASLLTWCIFLPNYSCTEAEKILNADPIYKNVAVCDNYSSINTTSNIGVFINKGYVFQGVTADEQKTVELFFNPVTGDYYLISK